MANARTRPPNRPRNERRSPRGHRPVPRKDSSLRTRLTEAATQLRTDGHTRLAEAVDEVLAPNGWGKLRRTDPIATENLPANMPLRMPDTIRTAIKERAAGRRLADDANEALTAFIAGDFEPVQPGRGGNWVKGLPPQTGMVNLNVRPDEDLKRQADLLCGPDHREEWGWDMRSSHVVLGWLMHKYGLLPAVQAPDGRPFGFGLPEAQRKALKLK